MRTVDEQPGPDEGPLAQGKRDFRLALRLTMMAIYYWTRGRKIRAAYEACQARGEIFYVDEDPAEPERRIR